MAHRTLVAVHEVHDGVTGARIGSGSLVDPLFVLVHPPLDRRLAQQSARAEARQQTPGTTRLRLAIGWLAEQDDATVLEVVDVQAIWVAQDTADSAGPLVGLDLERASAAPVEVVHGGDGDPAVAARAILQRVTSTAGPRPGPAGAEASTPGVPHRVRPAAAGRAGTRPGGQLPTGPAGEVGPVDPPPSRPPVVIPRQLWCRAFPRARMCRGH